MTEQKANYTLTIEADSGYESTTEGQCTADQYGKAIAALHGEAPQRTWVGLTDDEKQEWIDAMPYDPQPRHCMILVNVIEAKLKEKNT